MEIQTTVEHEIDANYLHFVVFCGGSVPVDFEQNYNDVIIGTGLTIVYSTVFSGADQRKHQSSASRAFVRGIHRCRVYLTHLRLNKMTAIFVDDILKCIFLNENGTILIQISQKIVPRSPTDKKRALAQLMAGRRTGTKPLLEPMITQLTDAHMRH